MRNLAPCLLLALAALGCAGPAPAPSANPAESPSSELELAFLMGYMQTYGDKIGHAVQGRNRPLATFYLDKMDLLLADVERIGRWQGIEVGAVARATLAGSLGSLRAGLEANDWQTSGEAYRAMTLACNSCHLATRQEAVVILPVTGDPPWAQRFEAP